MQIGELSLSQIFRIGGNNPRIVNRKSEEFRELVESIKAMGVKVPIHVCESDKGKPGSPYELLAGERRYLAADEAGLDTIPAINHGEISDEAAFEITLAENFNRKDLTPLEQGKAVVMLLAKFKNDVEAVASRMNKSVRWVMQRRAIQNNLSPKWKKAIVGDPDYKNWTASHLQLIAAMPQDIQDELLERYDCPFETPTVNELDKVITDLMRLLSKAPWDLDNAKMVEKTKACSKCTKRSSCQPGLFDDTTDAEVVQKNDRCLDANCWAAKLRAHLDSRAAELKKAHPNLIYAVMPDDSFDYYEKQELGERFGNIANEWKASKEGVKDAVPALIVAGNNAGELRWVKFPKTSTRSGGTREVGAGGKAKPTSLKERRAMLDRKRWFVVIRNLIEKIQKSPVDQIVSKDRVLTVMALTAAFGTSMGYEERERKWGNFAKIKTTDDALNKLWAVVRDTIWKNLSYCGPITQTPDDIIESAKHTAKLLGIDIEAMFKEAAAKDYPEPKSWANLKADGTPKTAKPKKGKKQVRKCRICGCTEEKACQTAEGPCHWVKEDLCSACVDKQSKPAKKSTKSKKSKK